MRSRFLQYFSVSTLVYVLSVILWGIFVHATTNRPPETQTLFELAYRISSGLCFGWVGVLLYLARKQTHPSDPIRRSALWAFVFLITDALVSPVIMLYEWALSDASFSGTISTSLHSINSFFLLAALTVTVFRAREIR